MKRSAYKSKDESIDPYITKIEFNHLISWFFDSNVNDINLNKFIALCRNKIPDFGSAMEDCFFKFYTTKLSDMHPLAMSESF